MRLDCFGSAAARIPFEALVRLITPSRATCRAAIEGLANGTKGIGHKTVSKLLEAYTGGAVARVEASRASQRVQTIALFSSVWGCGPKVSCRAPCRPIGLAVRSQSGIVLPHPIVQTAGQWWDMGCRSLEDVRAKLWKSLAQGQRMGLTHHADLLQRIPRRAPPNGSITLWCTDAILDGGCLLCFCTMARARWRVAAWDRYLPSKAPNKVLASRSAGLSHLTRSAACAQGRGCSDPEPAARHGLAGA